MIEAEEHKAKARQLIQEGRLAEALKIYQRLTEQHPGDAEVWYMLGIIYGSRGLLNQSVDAFQRAIKLRPDYAAAHNKLGVAYTHQGKLKEAEAEYRASLRIAENFAEAHLNLGAIAQRMGNMKEAETCFREVLRIQPDDIKTLGALGGICVLINKLTDARDIYDRLCKLTADDSEVWFRAGLIRVYLHSYDEAVPCLQKSLALNPNRADAYSIMGDALKEQWRYDDAKKAYLRALELDAGNGFLWDVLGVLYFSQGKVTDAEKKTRQALRLEPDHQRAQDRLLAYLNYTLVHSSSEIFSEHLRAGERYGGKGEDVVFRNSTVEERQLKVGYVSGDFRQHSVAHFVEALLRHHDRKQIDVTCYSNAGKEDAMSERLRGMADHWIEIAGQSDEQVAKRIYRDEIDILVDLSGHTKGNRLDVFARRAAPIQVTYLGYPNTTGLKEMDYRLTDGWADPEERNPDRYYTEQLVRLEGGFLSYTPSSGAPRVAPLPALAKGHITFGSFNNPAKVNEQVIRVWSKILKAVPDSRMMLKYLTLTDIGVQERYWRLFESEGIERERVELAGRIASQASHLDLYNRVDIGLDPFPYNGTTTTCEALWMGVPVVVLAGDRHVGRVGVSLLSQAGLDEWIAEDEESYVEVAVSWARRLGELQELRMSLRDRLLHSSVCDGAAFAHDIEQAYRRMWQKWCATGRA